MDDAPVDPAETEPDLECQIRVAAPGRDRSVERLAAPPNVPLAPDHVMNYGCVTVEWDHHTYEGTGSRADFLDWHSLLTCRPRPDAPPSAVVADVVTILEAIRTAGYRAVPTCDHEDLSHATDPDRFRTAARAR
ncbi:hypothetical protein SNE510_28900 [Streptomyces sp. NE5-10]|uniref:hypothetical protein n=1 Tax=Streptomyces sp. NE5-10 TaxID=2759674 RepID=UPI0019049854|nr:hypothetical protein [Streptomyces sp. NE5-10]GHJ93371.1 hypothetical protein SNE510_28900 [Streptomyces sp. NE5-10]